MCSRSLIVSIPSVVWLVALMGAVPFAACADEPAVRPDPAPFCGTVVDDAGVNGLPVLFTPRASLNGPWGPPRALAAGPCTEDGSRLDIMIVYTPALLAAEGDVAAVQALADAAIAELNLVFANSGVPTTAVLAGLREAGGYTESGFLSTNLARLRTPGDGYLDDVHAWRDQDRADLVCLFVSTGDVLGIANYAVLAGYQPRPDLGFSVVQRAALDPGDAVFAHEIGHNLGLQHQVEADPCVLAAADRAGHGYKEPGGAFQTVMSTGGVEPQSYRFSDPFALEGGLPAGEVGVAENALVAAQSVVTASRFRDRDQDLDGTCDSDQIAATPGLDCNGNGVLDQFDTDLNLNGSPDDCDIASGASLDLDGDGVPDEAELARVYVDTDAAFGGQGSSWGDATNDLQFAMALARASMDTTEIWIAEGTYTPGLYKADTFDLVGGVAMLGGFGGTETDASQSDPDTHEAILSGDLAGDDDGDFTFRDDNSITVVYGYGEDGLITLDGLTISGGHSVDMRFCNSSGRGIADGGGVFVLFCDIEINNCRVVNNAALRGGGLMLPDVNSWSLNDTVVSYNRAIGEQVAATSGGAYLTAIQLPGNVTRCEFLGNSSDGSTGGVFFLGGSPVVTDTTFIGNYSKFAGNAGFYARLLENAEFSNITVAFNSNAPFNITAGASFDSVSTGTISNSIFWGNKVYYSNGSTYDNQNSQLRNFPNMTLSSTTVQFWDGTLPGIGNNGDDPLFLDPIGPDGVPDSGDEDVRLAAGSGAIDSGDDALTNSAIDLDGNPRFVGPVDRGAYEAQPPACPADINMDGVLDNGDIGAFVAAFLVGSQTADFNGDSILDNGDIGAFVAAFLAGC